MSSLIPFAEAAWAEALAWAVLHSLWQASLLAIVLRFLLQLLPARRVRLRYRLAYGALLLQGLAFGLTAWWSYPVEILAEASSTNSFVWLAEQTAGVGEVSLADLALDSVEPYLPLILSFWLIGLGFFLLRLGVGMWQWQRLRHVGLSVVPTAWQACLAGLCAQLGVSRKVEIAFSSKVSGPMILGQLKPLILLPVGLVNQLSLEEVELILTHELAHLQRYDFVFNLIQSVLEAILYYHPAVWWTGNQIRTLREACCDEWVTTTPGRSLQYARTLLTLAERAQGSHSSLQLALLGNRRGALYQRIQHILNQPTKTTSDMREKFAVTALLLLLAIGVSLHASSVDADLFPETPPLEWKMTIDTLPEGNIRFNIADDGETFDVELADRKIKQLKINGEEIPAERFPEYEKVVEEKMAGFPAPPPPPPPVAPPAPGAPVAPPAPPVPSAPQRIVIDIDSDELIYLNEDMENIDLDEFIDYPKELIQTINVSKDDGSGHATVRIVKKDGTVQVFKIRDTDEEVIEKEHRVLIERERERAGERREVIRFERDHARALSEQAREMARLERELELQRRGELELTEKEVERLTRDRERLSEEMGEMAREMVAEKEIIVLRSREAEEAAREALEDIDFEWRTDSDARVRVVSGGDDWLKSYLHGEGYLPDLTNYSIKLDSKRLKVDGKRLSDEVHQQILEMYEEIEGEPLSGSISKSERSN